MTVVVEALREGGGELWILNGNSGHGMSDVVRVPVMATMKGQGAPEVACTQIPCELHAG